MQSGIVKQKNNPVVIIALITAASLLGDSMLYIVLPIHWKEAGLLSLWEVGVLLSANRLVRLPLNPFVGWLYTRISSRAGIMLAIILAGLTTLSYGFIKGFYPLLIIRCIWGLAWTFLRLGAYITIIEFSNDNNRGYYMGIYNGLFRIGSLVGMLFGGILADYLGLKIIALSFSIVTFFTMPFSFKYIPRSIQGGSQIKKVNRAETENLLRSNILWPLATGLLIAMIYQGIFNATLSHIIEVHNSSPIFIFGINIGVASLAGLLQALRWSWEPWLAPWLGRMSDGKCGRRPILAGTLVSAGLLFMLVPTRLPLAPWLLVLVGIQLTATILTTLADALASDVASSSSKITVMSWYSFSTDIGAALGPLVGYFLSEQAGTYAAYWGAAGVLIILAIRWLISHKAPR